MRQEQNLTPADRELEAALGRLKAAPSGIDYDALMYRSGQESVRRRQKWWQGATVVLALALGIALVNRPSPSSGPNIATETARQTTPQAPKSIEISQIASLDSVEIPRGGLYLTICQAVLSQGWDALPDQAGPATNGKAKEPEGVFYKHRFADPIKRFGGDSW